MSSSPWWVSKTANFNPLLGEFKM